MEVASVKTFSKFVFVVSLQTTAHVSTPKNTPFNFSVSDVGMVAEIAADEPKDRLSDASQDCPKLPPYALHGGQSSISTSISGEG